MFIFVVMFVIIKIEIIGPKVELVGYSLILYWYGLLVVTSTNVLCVSCE